MNTILPTVIPSTPVSASPAVPTSGKPRVAFQRPARPLPTGRLTKWHLLVVALLVSAGVFITREAWFDIYSYAANDEEHSHILLAPIVAAYLVWMRRVRLRHFHIAGTLWGPLIVSLGAVCWWYGFNEGKQFLWHGGSVLIALGLTASIVGKNLFFRFFPAVLVLAFMIPIPGRVRQEVAMPLQHWTAQIAQVLLDLMGVPSQVSGNTLICNNKPVMIAEACNGMRLVFTLLLISFAFALGMPLRNSVRTLLICCSPVIALLCNVVRTVPTIWLYSYQSTAVADAFHYWGGWAMPVVAFLILLGMVKAMRWAMIPVERYTLATQGS